MPHQRPFLIAAIAAAIGAHTPQGSCPIGIVHPAAASSDAGAGEQGRLPPRSGPERQGSPAGGGRATMQHCSPPRRPAGPAAAAAARCGGCSDRERDIWCRWAHRARLHRWSAAPPVWPACRRLPYPLPPPAASRPDPPLRTACVPQWWTRRWQPTSALTRSLSASRRQLRRYCGSEGQRCRGTPGHVPPPPAPTALLGLPGLPLALPQHHHSASASTLPQGNLVPLYERVMADQLTPVLAYRCLVKEDDREAPSFLFESVTNGTQQVRSKGRRAASSSCRRQHT